MGVRLKSLGNQAPKGCLHLGEESIIEESILRSSSGKNQAALIARASRRDRRRLRNLRAGLSDRAGAATLLSEETENAQ